MHRSIGVLSLTWPCTSLDRPVDNSSTCNVRSLQWWSWLLREHNSIGYKLESNLLHVVSIVENMSAYSTLNLHTRFRISPVLHPVVTIHEINRKLVWKFNFSSYQFWGFFTQKISKLGLSLHFSKKVRATREISSISFTKWLRCIESEGMVCT